MLATAVKERPILFSGEMVRAILDGRKTMTRRVVKPQPGPDATNAGVCSSGEWFWLDGDPTDIDTVGCTNDAEFHCPYGWPGDQLWVRENGWERPERTQRMMREGADTWPRYIYDADTSYDADWCKEHGWKRRPSIHMPRWASRITLEITDVRVERLHDISEEDAIAEGSQIPIAQLPKSCRGACLTERTAFSRIWESINGPGSWEANPWVWVVCFRRLEVANG